MQASSLSGLGVRKRNDGRARTDFDDFDAHIGNTNGEIGEIWTALPPLQPHHPESDRLLGQDYIDFLQHHLNQTISLENPLQKNSPYNNRTILMGIFVSGLVRRHAHVC